MNHDKYQEWMILQLYEELEPEEKKRLRTHLQDCTHCRKEWQRLQALHQTIDRVDRELPEAALRQARTNLAQHLEFDRNDRPSSSWREAFVHLVAPFFQPARWGAAVAMLLLGLGIGYLLFASGERGGSPIPWEPSAKRGAQISDVQFSETAQDGEVELSFQVSRRVKISGALEDPKIQRLLAHALISESNPGVRLRAVTAMQNREEDLLLQETQVALISALRTDKNPAVRKEALAALAQMPSSPRIRQTLSDVLLSDENARLRIEAINALQSQYTESQIPEKDLLDVLQKKVEEDENDYVRRRAKAFLRQISTQL